MAGNTISWRLFVEDGRRLFDESLSSPHFQLVERLDRLYALAYSKGLFPKTGSERDDLFHMCFLVCHHSLLAAATITGSGHPADGSVITRRALEAAKTAFAINKDQKNFEIWKREDIRAKRWNARIQGGRPIHYSPRYKAVGSASLYSDLEQAIGTLSDVAGHFTPEYLNGYRWVQFRQPGIDSVRVSPADEDIVQQEILMLFGQHRLILHVFNHCLDGKISSDPEVQQLSKEASDLCRALLRQAGYESEAEGLVDFWVSRTVSGTVSGGSGADRTPGA